MRRAKAAVSRSSSHAAGSIDDSEATNKKRNHPTSGREPVAGLRERKKARLRQQIIETSLHLFRQRGYEKTRIDDIVHTLEISRAKTQFCAKSDAVLLLARQRASSRNSPSKRRPSSACDDFTKLWETRLKWVGHFGRP